MATSRRVRKRTHRDPASSSSSSSSSSSPGAARPTLRLALLRPPGHGARLLLASLLDRTRAPFAPHPPTALWRAHVSTRKLALDVTVGMPAAAAAADALVVVVDVHEGVTSLHARALRHARLRIAAAAPVPLLAFIHGELAAGDVGARAFDGVELELRTLLNEHGFAGDDVPIVRSVGPASVDGYARATDELIERIDTHLIEREPAAPTQLESDDAERLRQCLSTTALRKNGAASQFDVHQLQRAGLDMRDDGGASYDDRWRLHSIIRQLAQGWFDDVPDLIALGADRGRDGWRLTMVARDLLGYVGDVDLLPAMGDIRGADRCSAMDFWASLPAAAALIDGFQAGEWPGDLCFVYPWAIRRILVEPGNDALRSRWERHVPAHDLAQYCEEARARLATLRNAYGNDAKVLHARRFSLERMARIIVDGVEHAPFSDMLAGWLALSAGEPTSRRGARALLDDGTLADYGNARWFFRNRIPPPAH